MLSRITNGRTRRKRRVIFVSDWYSDNIKHIRFFLGNFVYRIPVILLIRATFFQEIVLNKIINKFLPVYWKLLHLHWRNLRNTHHHPQLLVLVVCMWLIHIFQILMPIMEIVDVCKKKKIKEIKNQTIFLKGKKTLIIIITEKSENILWYNIIRYSIWFNRWMNKEK